MIRNIRRGHQFLTHICLKSYESASSGRWYSAQFCARHLARQSGSNDVCSCYSSMPSTGYEPKTGLPIHHSPEATRTIIARGKLLRVLQYRSETAVTQMHQYVLVSCDFGTGPGHYKFSVKRLRTGTTSTRFYACSSSSTLHQKAMKYRGAQYSRRHS